MRQRPDPQLDAVEHLEALGHVEGDDGDEARRQPALGNEGDAGVGRELLDAARARHVLGEVEIVRARGAGRFRNARRQMERGGIEHRKLSVEQIDQLGTVLDIGRHGANALVAVAAGEHLGRAIRQGDLVIARRGEQLGHRGADFPGADHDDVLHPPSARSSDDHVHNNIPLPRARAICR